MSLHCFNTVVFRNPLINSLTLDNDLLACLVKFCLITPDQHERLSKNLTQNGIKESVKLLLIMIEGSKRPDVVSFINALRESGDQTNVLLADLIEGVDSIQDFDIEHQLINEFYTELQVIDPTEMVPYLKYINLDEKESLMRKCEMGESSQARTTLLVMTIRTLEPGWFEEFLYALEKTGHGNVAEKLKSALASRNKQSDKEPYSNLSRSIESLNLLDNDHMEVDATQESEGGLLQYGFKETDSCTDSPARSSHPCTQQRSCLSSTKRPRSPNQQNVFKRKRSPSPLELPQQGATYNINHYHVNAKGSTNLNAVLGAGDHNTINLWKEEKGQVSQKEARTQTEPRRVDEDQPDHAAMPPEDDIQADNMVTGDACASQEDKMTSSAQRPELFVDQLELAEDAIKGKNTVLVAPTGSGKTHVAAYIIHDHFMISLQSKLVQERCALFLVTTVNLVDQQKNKMKELLRPVDFFSVTGLSGTSELSLQEGIMSKNVIVLTAQLLENALNDDSNNITLDRFSLLVFDECHLCQKKHAYNAIMARYLDEKHCGIANLPQIIGMTASLGTGKAKDQHQANQHTIQICANMDAQSISMVTRHKEDLEKRVNIPKEVEPIEVNCRKLNPFADKIKQIMKKVEQLLLESPSDAIRQHVKVEKIPTEKGSQAYRQWCDRMKRNAQTIILQAMQADYRIFQTCIRHLMGYNSALVINKQVRSKDAYKYLEQIIGKEKERMHSFDENDYKLIKIFSDEQSNLERIKDDPDNENPLLEKLCQIILEEYRIRPRFRAILFVKTIDTTQALQEWIQDTPELAFLSPGRIAGSRDMNSNQQNEVIKDFRIGTHHMLVATNLLEQGTDVPACNLVIRLDYVPSDFGHVQIKGRTRAKDGRSYLISLIDSNAANRNEANRQREIMMDKAALNLKANSEATFLELMKSRQEGDKSKREIEQKQKRENIERNKAKIFSFYCGSCGEHALKSHDIRLYFKSYYVVLNSDISNKMIKKALPKPDKVPQGFTIVAQVFCYKCGHVWGALIRVNNLYYPCIKIACFSLVDVDSDDKEGTHFSSWTEANLDIKTIDHLPAGAAVELPIDLLKKLNKL